MLEATLNHVIDTNRVPYVASTLSGEYRAQGIDMHTDLDGGVTISRWQNGQYVPTQILTTETPHSGFGHAVSIATYSSLLAVSAPKTKEPSGSGREGRVYLYRQSGDGQYQYVGGGYANFMGMRDYGHAISLSGNGRRIGIGFTENGVHRVMVCRIDSQHRLIPLSILDNVGNLAQFGHGIWLNANGDSVAVLGQDVDTDRIYYFSI